MSTKASTPYPTSYAIEDMFSSQGGVATRRETLNNIIDDNVDAKVVGYDYYFSGEHKGKDSLMKKFVGELFGMCNEDTLDFEVVRVIGGGESPWAAIEAKATAKSETGM